MNRSRLTLMRAGLLAVVLTAGGALVAYAALPSASDNGQARAAAGGANGLQDSHPSQDTGNAPSSVSDQLSTNQDRLLSHLQDVVDQLSSGDASSHAVDALNRVIDRLTNDDIGLNRAMDATSGNTGKPDLPAVVSNHPSQP
jgi:hypothetical protein